MNKAMTVAFAVAVAVMLVVPASAQDNDAEKQADIEAMIVLSEKEFLQDLSTDIPELQEVHKALADDDIEKAKSLYIDYFRSREIAHPLLEDWAELERDPEYDTSQADKLLARHF
ncbi:MAG: hypothetical protein R6V19_01575 [Armatimonadota bacterium]